MRSSNRRSLLVAVLLVISAGWLVNVTACSSDNATSSSGTRNFTLKGGVK